MKQEKINLSQMGNETFKNEGFNPPKTVIPNQEKKGFNPPKTSQPKPVDKPNK